MEFIHLSSRTGFSNLFQMLVWYKQFNQDITHVVPSIINSPLVFLLFFLQPGGAEESQAGPPDPFRYSLPDAGLEQRFELGEDQPQPLESPLPQAAAQPHEVRIQGPQALQYPPPANHIHCNFI